MEGKIAAIGNVDFATPFSALGVDTYAVGDETDSIISTAKEVLENKYTLVILAENIAEKAEAVFLSVQNKPLPCVIVVPFTTEPSGVATESLRHTLKMATGIDILKNN
ncbi:MAG: hypothetical protein JW804_02300 [Sedimentisphaerales bacterium]|nr:hypothetical protein [Sedimentisphaerales bacterium]